MERNLDGGVSGIHNQVFQTLVLHQFPYIVPIFYVGKERKGRVVVTRKKHELGGGVAVEPISASKCGSCDWQHQTSEGKRVCSCCVVLGQDFSLYLGGKSSQGG